MLSDRDIDQLARLLVDVCGDKALLEADRLTGHLRNSGDPDWERVRSRLKPAIEALRGGTTG